MERSFFAPVRTGFLTLFAFLSKAEKGAKRAILLAFLAFFSFQKGNAQCGAGPTVTTTAFKTCQLNQGYRQVGAGPFAQITVAASGGTAPYHVAWSGPSSGNPAGTEIASSGGTYNITNLAAGNYSITTTDANSCTTVKTETVANPTHTAGVITAVNGQTSSQGIPVCWGGTQQLQSSGPAGGDWLRVEKSPFNVVSINNMGLVTPLVTNPCCVDSHTVLYRVTENGCAISAARQMVVVDPLNPGTISGPTAVCFGNTIQLTETGASSGFGVTRTWSSSDQNVATVSSSGLVLAGTTAGQATITHTVSNQFCSYSASQVVSVGPCCPTTGIFYVKANATGANTGLSWADAFTDLQSALNSNCPDITQIWVAEGTYKPTATTDRTISFSMKNGVEILGGFPNTGDPGLGDRDWAAHLTVLSGEIGAAGMADNTFNIIRNTAMSSTAVLDGFQIAFGNASGGNDRGGAMDNQGGASPTIRNCVFMSNLGGYGGAIYAFTNAFPTFTNCGFIGNQANAWGGAAFSESASFYTFVNCSFSGNMGAPGVIYSNGLPAVIKNCIIWGNGTQAIVGAATITNSIIEGGFAGTGNLNVNPLFVSQPPVGLGTAGDLRLQDCSPAIDAGLDADNPTDFDLGFLSRKSEGITGGQMIDMGAFENQTFLAAGDRWHVNATAISGNGTSWACAFRDLQSALAVADAGDEIWVAKGTYKPTATTDRSISFKMKNGVEILGGFPNTGDPGLGDRDWAAHLTTLSGEIGAAGVADNTLNIIKNTGLNLNATAVIDGFQIAFANGTGVRGGGIENGNNSSPTIRNCAFLSNSASNGGAINNSNGCSPTITNCTFTSNIASNYGGAVMCENGSAPTFEGCTFSNNSAVFGGGIFAATTNLTITACDFATNAVTSSGGAIYRSGGTFNANNCTFTSNTAGRNGGAIETGGGISIIADCTFSSNIVTSPTTDYGYGGAFFITSGMLNFTDCGFFSNLSRSGGGAICNRGASTILTFERCHFKENVCHNGSTIGTGGALQMEYGGNATFSNCLLDGNKGLGTADDGGGALMNYGGTITVVNSTIVNSHTGRYGGAISNRNASGTANSIVKNTIFSNNTAVVSSPTIYNPFGGVANLSNCLIPENTCPTNAVCGAGNLFNVAPFFVSATDFRLQDCSPAIDAGLDAATTTTVDFDQNQRKSDALANAALIDMGAFEFQESATPTVAICPPSVDAFLDENGSVTVLGSALDGGSTGCGPLVFSVGGQPSATFDCSQIGSNSVTMTATYVNRVSTCTTSVQVIDNLVPTVECQNATVFLDADGLATVSMNDVFLSGSDNCGNTFLESVTPNAFTCNELGQNSVGLKINDGKGNSATCPAVVTVADEIAPTVVCKNATIFLNANGLATVSMNQVFGSGSDNCGGVFLESVMPNAFTCNELGQNQVVLKINDGKGNEATCPAVVTVADNLAPTAVCKNISVDLVGSTATISASQIDNGSFDNCEATTFLLSKTTFFCADLGQNQVVLTVKDAQNNAATCSATVTVKDETAPIVTCAATTVTLAANENYTTVLPAQVVTNVAENCSIASLTVSPSLFNCSNIGSNTVTIIATDASGKTGTCQTTVEILAPVSTISVADKMVIEGSPSGTTSMLFSVVRSNARCAASVQYSTADATAFAPEDYSQAVGTLTFWPGQASQNVPVLIKKDSKVELLETFSFNLTNPVGGTFGDNQAIGTIQNDDAAAIQISNVSTSEGNIGLKNLTFTATILKAADVPISFDFSTADGTATLADNDYVSVPTATATIPAGLLSQTFSIQLKGDTKFEANETVNLNFSNVQASGRSVTLAQTARTATILNDDVALFVGTNDDEKGQKAEVEVAEREAEKSLEPNSEIDLFPNPTTDFLNVILEKGDWQITVFDVAGKMLFTQKANIADDELFQIDAQKMPEGVHFLKAENLAEPEKSGVRRWTKIN